MHFENEYATSCTPMSNILPIAIVGTKFTYTPNKLPNPNGREPICNLLYTNVRYIA